MALTRITKGVIKPNENYDTHNIVSTGIVTSVGLDVNGNADVSGSLSVGGVLTYEDVTSIDSVGIITARSGLVSPYADIDDFVSVGSNIHLGNAGVVTATSFVGSGAALTGIDATAIKDSGGNVKIQAQASGAIHTGVSTFQDIDVDGHTNLDNVSIAGVVTATQIKLQDNKFLLIGDGNDLQLRHDGSHSYIQDTGTGNLYLTSNNFNFFSPTNEKFAVFNNHSSVELYYDNSLKLTTASNGIDITGMCTDDGARHDGDVYFIGATSGRNAVWDMSDDAFEFADNAKVKFGSSDDLQIYHDTTDSLIDFTNTAHNLRIRGDGDIRLEARYNELSLRAVKNGQVELYYDNSIKFQTSEKGIKVGTGVTVETNGQATFTGIVTASTYYGDGSNLSNITSTTINSNTNNYLITGTGTANTLQGEANLTFDGSTLTADGDVLFKSTTSGREVLWDKSIDRMIFRTNARASFGNSSQLSIWHNGSSVGYIEQVADGYLRINGNDGLHFYTKPSGGSATERLRIGSAGQIGIAGANYGSSGQVLTSGGSGSAVTWSTLSTDLVSDTSPQLGGDLASNGSDIKFANNDKAIFGTGNDAAIYHNDTDFVIDAQDSGSATRNMYLNAGTVNEGGIFLRSAAGDTMLKGLTDDGVYLYFDNDLKFRTVSSGSEFRGDVLFDNHTNTGKDILFDESDNALEFSDNVKATFGSGGDMEIFHDGTTNRFQSNGLKNFQFNPKDTDVGLKILGDGGVELYYDGGKTAETVSGGFTVSGNLTATGFVDSSSDIKLKTNIKTIDNALDKVLQLRGAEYDRIDRDNQHEIGVIAQEVEKVIPEVVHGDETKTVSYGNLVGLLIEAVKDLKKEIDELKSS